MKYFLLFLLISNNVFSQEICGLNNNKYDFYKSLNELNRMDNRDYSLEKSIISKISSSVYVSSNFKLVNIDGIENALALINPIDDKRYILYDRNYFDVTSSENIWYKLFIFSHEIAHHLNGHTIGKNNDRNYLSSQGKELQCDFFAGYILYKLGAKEIDVINLFKFLPEPENEFSSHPKNYKRISATLNGFRKEFNKDLKAFNQQKEILLKEFIEKSNEIECKNAINTIEHNVGFYISSREKGYLNIAYSELEKLNKKCRFNLNFYKYIIYKELDLKDKLIDLLKTEFYSDINDDFVLVRYLDALEMYKIVDLKLQNILLDRFPSYKLNSEYINNQVGIHFTTYKESKYDNLAFLCFKTAYDSIKYKESDNLLKSDIFIAYAKSIYSKEIESKENRFTFAKNLLIKGVDLMDELPESFENRYYKATALFHLGCIDNIEGNYVSAEKNFSNLIKLKDNYRKDLIVKSFYNLFMIYKNDNKLIRALECITKSIELSDEKELKIFYLLERIKVYSELKEEELVIRDVEETCNLGFKKSCEVLTKKSKDY